MAVLADARRAFFSQLVRDIDLWVDYVAGSGENSALKLAPADVRWAFLRLRRLAGSDVDRQALKVAMLDTLIGLVHSVLVAIDGGSRMTEEAKVDLVTEQGISLGPGLHELFMDYLVKEERVPLPPEPG